jgi:hypothetical protein
VSSRSKATSQGKKLSTLLVVGNQPSPKNTVLQKDDGLTTASSIETVSVDPRMLDQARSILNA